MAKHTVTLHMYEYTEEWREKKPTVFDADFRNVPSCMENLIWLGQVDVEVDWPEVDTRQLQIDALEKQIEKERADSQMRVNLLLERISQLKAIAHEVAE